MNKFESIEPVFVHSIPPAESVKEGKLYISREFQTAVHKCCCGCGEEVVTPLNPAQWRLTEKRGKVSLHPSVGNWSYNCQSHYFINENRIFWAAAFSKEAIKRVKANDQRAIDQYIAAKNARTLPKRGIIETLSAAIIRGVKRVKELIWPKK